MATATALERILIIRGPREDICIDISTPEKYQQVALAIVNQRMKQGWFKEPEKPTPPEMSEREVKKLPKGKVREFAQSLWAQYNKDKKVYDGEKQGWDTIQRCITENDGELAISIISQVFYPYSSDLRTLEVLPEYPIDQD